MANERLMRMLQVLVVTLAAVFVGRQVVNGGIFTSFFLASIPVLIGLGLLSLKYPHFIAFFLMFLFYTNIDATLSLELQLHLGAVFFGGCIFYYLLLVVARRPIPALNLPTQLFFAFFVVCATVAALMPNGAVLIQYEWINSVALYGLNVFLLTYILCQEPSRFQRVAEVLVYAGVLLALVCIVEFFDRSLVNLSNVPGRSAGFMRNANPAAYSLLACFIISYMTRVRFLLIYRIIMFVGLYTTFTRAALMMFFLFLFYQEFLIQKLSIRRMVVSMLLIMGVIGFMLYGTFFLEHSNNKATSYAYQRVAAIQEGNFNDSSSKQRWRVIGINLNRFLRSPVTGNGVMTAMDSDSPHNQFLLIMAENGLIGITIWMAFLGSLLWKIVRMRKGPERRIMLSLFGFLILNMFTSHNLYHFRFYIVLFAFIASGAELYAGNVAAAARLELPKGEPAGRALRAPRALPVRREVGGGVRARRPERDGRPKSG